MKKSLLTLAVTAAMAVPMAASAAPSTKFFGYSQITAAVGGASPNDGIRFGADRIRLGYKVKNGSAFGKLQVDFNKTDASGTPKCDSAEFVTDSTTNPITTGKALTECSGSTNIGVPEIIKDAVVGVKLNKMAKVSAGVFKTPIGMDFNTSGKKLDITKRGMEKPLVLERAAGLMISGRKIGGFGYDLGIFNPAGRSGAVNGPGVLGQNNAYAARGMFDMAGLHLEASAGWSENAANNASGDGSAYKVWDVAARYKTGPVTAKFEYINGQDIKGKPGEDETVWYLHGGYKINNMIEAVARYYAASHNPATGDSTSLSNLYIGANVFLAKYDARVQVNYVVAGGDTDTYEGHSKGYTDNILLGQLQVGF